MAQSHQESNPSLSVALMLAASALVAATMLLAKALGTDVLGPPLHAFQVSQGRFMFALIAVASFAAVTRARITQPNWRMHVIRSGFGWGGVTLMFAAAAYIPLSDATAISFLSPVFGMMLAIVFLGERVGPVRWGAAATGLIGALILTRPGASALQIGALLALGSAILLGAEVVAIKFLSGREKPLQILLINNAIGVCLATGAASFVWQNPNTAQWFALITLGFVMAAAQTCFLNAVARADASFVTPFFYASLVFAALYDGVVFGVIPDWISVVGAITILTGAGVLAWREGLRTKS